MCFMLMIKAFFPNIPKPVFQFKYKDKTLN